MIGLLGGCSKTEYWTDEAKLGDGRLLKVHRYVVLKSTGGELSNAFKIWPVQYGFRVSHPDTNEYVKWSGDDHVTPVLLDVDSLNFYLVLLIGSAHESSTFKKYGCPTLPYVYLKRSKGASHWSEVGVGDFPVKRLKANLSAYYNFHWMAQDLVVPDREKNSTRYKSIAPHERIGFQTYEHIEGVNQQSEQSTSSFFQSEIPRNIRDWRYSYKGSLASKSC